MYNGVMGRQEEGIKIKDKKIEKILKRNEDLFQDDLPAGLPSERSGDHEIELRQRVCLCTDRYSSYHGWS